MNKYNTLPRRLIARVIDGSVLYMFYNLILVSFSFSIETEKFMFAVLYLMYYSFSLGKYSQTFGMFFIGTKLVNADDESMPSVKKVMVREMFGAYLVVLSLLMLERYAQGVGDKFRLFLYTQTSWCILQFFVVVMSKQHRTLHDYFANTVIIKVMPFGAKKRTNDRLASIH